jgi:hypothetical protein
MNVLISLLANTAVRYFVLFIFLLSRIDANCQRDTMHVQFKKGFYKSFDEYVRNSPSIVPEFTVIPVSIDPRDSSVMRVHYKVVGSRRRIREFWGFSDGTDVYVNDGKFWRMQCPGRYSLYVYSRKPTPIFLGPTLLITAVTAIGRLTESPDLYPVIINEKGRIIYPDHDYLVKILKGRQDLLDGFEADWSEYRKYDYQTDDPEPDEVRLAKLSLIQKYVGKLNEKSK